MKVETLQRICECLEQDARLAESGGVCPNLPALFRDYAARIRDAAGRERAATALMAMAVIQDDNSRWREAVMKCNQPGNAAAMREAAGNALWCLNWMGDHTSNESIKDHLAKPIELLTSALSAPPRNCDRFQTADAAWDAWMHGPGCRREGEGFVGLLDWLYAKEEGGAE